MIFLSNSLISPGVGTIFWSTTIFLLFFFILAKFAWKPILTMIKQREETIQNSLDAAAQAREEVVKLKGDNEEILRKAKEEREIMLKEARDIRDKMMAEARDKASIEAEKLISKAKNDIELEKTKALSEIKDQVATLSVAIASKLIGEQLSKGAEQQKLIDKYLKDINVN
ncbi:MAG: F0F1 ATP synthase subunit B [Bacteroidales bacterium]|jgi:F-type H+-transporting ATPase subunit b